MKQPFIIFSLMGLNEGMDPEDAYNLACQETELDEDDQSVRDWFRQAVELFEELA